MKIGVISIQGAVSEHIAVTHSAMRDLGISGTVAGVRKPRDMENVSALILPGGESTTIGKALVGNGLHELIKRRVTEGMPIMGTCAGCILLAQKGDEQVDATGTRLLGLMQMEVDRNAFGRQCESFETQLKIDGLGMFHAVFIRAPLITRVWGDCKPLASTNEGFVMARQGNMLALSFHPELTGDNRIHRMLLEMV